MRGAGNAARTVRGFLYAVGLLCLGISTKGADVDRSLSSQYGTEQELQRDSSVLFYEDFENGNFKKWNETVGTSVIVSNQVHQGQYAVEMSMRRGKNTGGDLKKWFLPGADSVYVRFYVRFSTNYHYNHHFVWLGANELTNKWSAFGKAGLKPDGSYFSTGMEPWFGWGKNPPPGEVNLYSYFLDMKVDPKMNKYWGNAFFPPGPGAGKEAGEDRSVPKLGEWECWEFMIKSNDPEKSNGEQAMWVNDKLIGKFTGIRWRNKSDLKPNCLWLEHYGYDEGDPTKQYWGEEQTVWFDDVVVARQRVGPRKR